LQAICEHDPEHDGLANATQLRAAVLKIDPNKDPDEVDALVRTGLMIERFEEVAKEVLDEDGNVVSSTTERKVAERRPCLPLESLPHEAVLFSINEFMSLVRKHPVRRESPAYTFDAISLVDVSVGGE
jgi:hypothetical protein